MATSKGSPTRTSKVLCSKLLAPTFLPPISLAPQVQIKFWISEIHAIQILRKLWGLSFPTLSWSSRTWRSISHLRFRWEVVESKQLTKILPTGFGRQKCAKEVQSIKLSIYHQVSISDSKVMNCYFRVKPFICTMPMRLDDGWNQIQVQESKITSLCPNCILSSSNKLQECISSHNCISSSTWPISHGEPMAQTMWRPWG